MLGTDLLASLVSRVVIQDIVERVTRMVESIRNPSSGIKTYHEGTGI